MSDEIDDDNNGAPPAPKSTATDLIGMLTPKFEKAFVEHGGGERISFMLGMQALPQEPRPGGPVDGNGNPMPLWEGMMVIYVDIGGILPRTRITRAMPIAPHVWNTDEDDERISQLTRAIVAELVEGRSQQLESMQRDAQEAAQEGRETPLSGLLGPNGQQML